MLERVISGGQTGADQAGWRAAKAAGIPTGGAMPKGFLTEDGSWSEFAELFGAHALESVDYAERTAKNVIASTGTIWFGDPTSRGGQRTLTRKRIVALLRSVVPKPSRKSRAAMERSTKELTDRLERFNYPPVLPGC